MTLIELLKTLTPEEVRYIAERDYGEDADLHLSELNLALTQDGCLTEGQYWYPYEVIQLSSNRLNPEHAREFAVCTLWVLSAVASKYDTATMLEWKLQDSLESYLKLPQELKDPILNAYKSAGL